jgi:hypothetical protein
MASAGDSETILPVEAEREKNAHRMFRLFLARHDCLHYCF